MFVTPRKEASPYYINETVEFQCNGNVGNPPENRPWSWQWKYADSMMDWTSYPYNNRITDDPVTPGNCVNQGRSTLRHVVSVDDNARMFRCLVNKNEMYSANFTIYTESKTVTTPRPGGSTGGDTSSADIGLIVGIVLGVLAVIAIVIVLVYFLWYRRRNSGEQYKTEEDKHPESNARPDHLTPNPVYDTRPEPKQYSSDKRDTNDNGGGLHYADLELKSQPPKPYRKDYQREPPTEYASIKLF
ncbi:uncharacterized protein LOC121386193 [Gigantopelta aegis]|uniref:uncharacterized protein LOC121386193 n=1 Tax=Gigantopelta aegis TaxID=1735272 RepID=UPI001B88C414|nr:uncharacterized protein LOC121386193 [Gigantopelta aegis]